MTDENLIRQIEQLLADLKSGDETALEQLTALLSEGAVMERIGGDKIDVSSIDHSTAVAIGRGARAVVYQHTDLPADILARLVALADFLEMQGIEAPPPLPEHIPTVGAGEDNYIFISYARPDQPIAERVEAYLMRAGFRVFRDTSVLRCGANWDMTIEQALRDAGRIVLLLSEHSMPYRKEVHREWFYFDQSGKPIHPLYLRRCDLHSRLYNYQYIPVGDDLYGALARLAAELVEPFEAVPEPKPGDRVVVTSAADHRDLPETMDNLLKAVRGEIPYAAISPDTLLEILKHRPASLTEYRLGRVAEWSQPRYQLDDRFVALTLLVDKGEQTEGARWVTPEGSRSFDDLRDVLREMNDAPALVLLGTPGSGKSTLLRRLQLDDSIERLREGNSQQAGFFVSLNGYRAEPGKSSPAPLDWLAARWEHDYPSLPPLAEMLDKGQVLLLLDGLNEIPHSSAADYADKVGLWRQFIIDQVGIGRGSRVVFSCRTLDYSAPLSSPDLRVPQVVVQEMGDEQVQHFLQAYLPAQADAMWSELAGSAQIGLFRNPYFLKLLVSQVETTHCIPRGRASLFTGFVRETLRREIERGHRLLQPDTLLSDRDHGKLTRNDWAGPFDLPERGLLIPSLSDLAFRMQESAPGTDSRQVSILYDEACKLLGHDDCDEAILRAGVELNVLDENQSTDEVKYFHQLLQEFFAARRLARNPNPDLVRVEWRADQVTPSLQETLETLADSDPLPPLPATGWEETTVLAAAMAGNPSAFIRDIMAANLPLAARCAANPEVKPDEALKRAIQDALIARTQDKQTDLRARITAGEALGLLGDPRFERKTGPHGEYLLPPLVSIPTGEYPIGDDDAPYDDEKPAHTVKLAAFQIGMFPVTNAEYALFMAAGGYEDERWWDTAAAKAWRLGEGSSEGSKQAWRDQRKTLQIWTEDSIYGLVKQNRVTSKQAEDWVTIRGWSDERFEQQIEEWYPSGKIYRQPEYWDDSRFNNAAQPVVGITWFEAWAYCAWLSEQTRQPFRLPTEVEREAAARGAKGRQYAYGPEYNPALCNTFETHIRRTTPVGVFPGGQTPEGCVDLAGNVWDWTSTRYDQERFSYPYRGDDGREDPEAEGYRVLRGGSWGDDQVNARCSSRFRSSPSDRSYYFGFRVCVSSPFSVNR